MKRLILCICLMIGVMMIACGTSEPMDIAAFVPYLDEGAVFYGTMSTLHDRGVDIPYSSAETASAKVNI